MEKLSEGEEVFIKTNPSRWHYVKWYGAAIAGAVILHNPAPLLFIPVIEMDRKATTFYVTDKRVVKSKALINKRIDSVNYNSITDVHVHQSVMQRMLNVGHVKINTNGTKFVELVFENTAKPEIIAAKVQEHQVKVSQLSRLGGTSQPPSQPSESEQPHP